MTGQLERAFADSGADELMALAYAEELNDGRETIERVTAAGDDWSRLVVPSRSWSTWLGGIGWLCSSAQQRSTRFPAPWPGASTRTSSGACSPAARCSTASPPRS